MSDIQRLLSTMNVLERHHNEYLKLYDIVERTLKSRGYVFHDENFLIVTDKYEIQYYKTDSLSDLVDKLLNQPEIFEN